MTKAKIKTYRTQEAIRNADSPIQWKETRLVCIEMTEDEAEQLAKCCQEYGKTVESQQWLAAAQHLYELAALLNEAGAKPEKPTKRPAKAQHLGNQEAQ